MSASYDRKQGKVGSLGPTENGETELFRAPYDLLIGNVVYTPAEDVRGAFRRPRFVELQIREPGDRKGLSVADASPQASNFFLPANVKQNVPISWSSRLQVREGEAFYWNSKVLGGQPGVPDPGGTVEVVFEARAVSEASPAERDWREYVPSYWEGKTLSLTYMEKPLAEVLPGGEGMHTWHVVGTFLESTKTGIALKVKTPHELGVESEDIEYPYELITDIRLLD